MTRKTSPSQEQNSPRPNIKEGRLNPTSAQAVVDTHNRLTNPVLRRDDAVSRIDGDARGTDIHNHRGGRPTGKDVCLVPTDNVSAPVSPTSESDAEGNNLKLWGESRPATDILGIPEQTTDEIFYVDLNSIKKDANKEKLEAMGK